MGLPPTPYARFATISVRMGEAMTLVADAAAVLYAAGEELKALAVELEKSELNPDLSELLDKVWRSAEAAYDASDSLRYIVGD
jgi:hypothetical protein